MVAYYVCLPLLHSDIEILITGINVPGLPGDPLVYNESHIYQHEFYEWTSLYGPISYSLVAQHYSWTEYICSEECINSSFASEIFFCCKMEDDIILCVESSSVEVVWLG